MNVIDTGMVAHRMRSRIIRTDTREILLSRLDGSGQEADLTVPPNFDGLGRIRHFRRDTAPGWPRNPLPIDPASHALGIEGGEMMRAQVFQNAACAWRCWYCYVPFELLAGDEARSQWVTAAEIVRRYSLESTPPRIIDLSGGSPDLTPEWIPWMMSEIRAAGIEETTFLWSDDNLSTDYYFDELSDADRRLVAEYANYARVCCFKGFDAASFSFNTTASADSYDRQFERFSRYLDAGLNLYAYVTLTGPTAADIEAAIATFIDRLQRVSPQLPLRTVPLRIEPFGPMMARRQRHDVIVALEVQEAAIVAWNRELATRYSAKQLESSIVSVIL